MSNEKLGAARRRAARRLFDKRPFATMAKTLFFHQWRSSVCASLEEIRQVVEHWDGKDEISKIHKNGLILMPSDHSLQLIEKSGKSRDVHDGVSPPRPIEELLQTYTLGAKSYFQYTQRINNIRLQSHLLRKVMEPESFGISSLPPLPPTPPSDRAVVEEQLIGYRVRVNGKKVRTIRASAFADHTAELIFE